MWYNTHETGDIMLKIDNVTLKINDKVLINNLNLNINDGEIHILMGKNGIGKSSIVKSIAGINDYEVTGKYIFNGEDITNFNIAERSKLGIYLVNQMPIQIEGVTNAEMLRVARSERTNEKINIFEFNKELENICKSLELDKSFIHREINVGCSGGERKKIEFMHLWMLKPSFIMLDEIDSGLDVDALKIIIKNLQSYYKEYNPSILIITHSNVLIDAFDNAIVHVLDDKKVITGDKSLANRILNEGFQNLSGSDIISEK